MNSTASSILTFTKSTGAQCDKDALTDFFGWMLQGILAGIAFTCLIGTCWLQKCLHACYTVDLIRVIEVFVNVSQNRKAFEDCHGHIFTKNIQRNLRTK